MSSPYLLFIINFVLFISIPQSTAQSPTSSNAGTNMVDLTTMDTSIYSYITMNNNLVPMDILSKPFSVPTVPTSVGINFAKGAIIQSVCILNPDTTKITLLGVQPNPDYDPDYSTDPSNPCVNYDPYYEDVYSMTVTIAATLNNLPPSNIRMAIIGYAKSAVLLFKAQTEPVTMKTNSSVEKSIKTNQSSSSSIPSPTTTPSSSTTSLSSSTTSPSSSTTTPSSSTTSLSSSTTSSSSSNTSPSSSTTSPFSSTRSSSSSSSSTSRTSVLVWLSLFVVCQSARSYQNKFSLGLGEF